MRRRILTLLLALLLAFGPAAAAAEYSREEALVASCLSAWGYMPRMAEPQQILDAMSFYCALRPEDFAEYQRNDGSCKIPIDAAQAIWNAMPGNSIDILGGHGLAGSWARADNMIIWPTQPEESLLPAMEREGDALRAVMPDGTVWTVYFEEDGGIRGWSEDGKYNDGGVRYNYPRSAFAESYYSFYEAQNAVDGNIYTSWISGKAFGDGDVNIQVFFSRVLANVNEVRLLTGDHYNKAGYEMMARPRDIEIVLYDKDGQKIAALPYTLEDDFGQWQTIAFDTYYDVQYFIIYVHSVYEGNSMNNIAIAEIQFNERL